MLGHPHRQNETVRISFVTSKKEVISVMPGNIVKTSKFEKQAQNR